MTTTFNLDSNPKSARQVCLGLQELGFPGIELWKDSQTKHYVWNTFESPKELNFNSETILHYDMRIKEETFRDLFWDFLIRLEDSYYGTIYCENAKHWNPLVKNLRKLLTK